MTSYAQNAWPRGGCQSPNRHHRCLLSDTNRGRARGGPLWLSEVLPHSTHDLTAAREHVAASLPKHGACL
jgi:hypothetical protein